MKALNNKYALGVLALLLIAANIFVWTQGISYGIQKKNADEYTDSFEEETVVITDQNRRTLMTHLYTMDTFLDEANKVFDEKSFPEGVTAMVAFDGDSMGKKKEEYGDGTTDRLCVAFAETVKRWFPDSDKNIVTNVGEKSDEYYMLLMGRKTRAEVVNEIAAFQEDIRKQTVKADDGVRTVSGTVSIGIAFYNEGDSFEGLFDEAGQAAYEAKEAGKDCYRISDDLKDETKKEAA